MFQKMYDTNMANNIYMVMKDKPICYLITLSDRQIGSGEKKKSDFDSIRTAHAPYGSTRQVFFNCLVACTSHDTEPTKHVA